LATRKQIFGTILFSQTWIGLLASTTPGRGPLWDRVGVEQSVTPTLWLLLGIQLLFVALEISTRPLSSVYERLSPLATPPQLMASALAVLLGAAGLFDGIHSLTFSQSQQALLLVTLLLT